MRLLHPTLLLFACVLWIARAHPLAHCSQASVTLVESIPLETNISSAVPSTYEALMELVTGAQKSIDIAAYYMTLTDGNQYPSSDGGWMGQNLFNALIAASKQRNVSIRIVQNNPSAYMPANDTSYLQSIGAASVRSINWPLLFNGYGILHTKFIVIDKKHFYIGSANYDWRSLAQVKELGSMVKNCATLAADLDKIFDMYWMVAVAPQVPQPWPAAVRTTYNASNPIVLHTTTGDVFTSYFATSPPPFATGLSGRTNDIDAITGIINSALTFVHFSVMDYSPVSLYRKNKIYWPLVDDALRNAAVANNASVRLLFSWWDHTSPSSLQYMHSLNALDNIEVRLMKIPPNSGKPIPFTRVNHSKYIVSEAKGYITTSNCSPDYLLDTGGVSITFTDSDTLVSAQEIFDRDWNGPYAFPLSAYTPPM